MKIVLHKAHAVGGTSVPDLIVNVFDAIPAQPTIEASRRLYREEARALVKALRESLPGGTVDAILVELLEAKLSMLRIPDVEVEPR